MLPKVRSVNMITPMVRKRPERSARAAEFGRYPSARIESMTRALVAASTFEWPFDTRDTVCEETPACRATSPIDGRAAFRVTCVPSVVAMAPQ